MESGYRYSGTEQVATRRLIGLLRAAEMPLEAARR